MKSDSYNIRQVTAKEFSCRSAVLLNMKPLPDSHSPSNILFNMTVALMLFIGVFTGLFFGAAPALADVQTKIYYLEQQVDRAPSRSSLIQWPDDDGLMGAKLGIEDNATTGKFLKHTYSLEQHVVDNEQELLAQARRVLGQGSVLLILNAPAESVVAVAQLTESEDDLIFNAYSMRNSLRDEQCYPNVLHSMPSRNMLADALMQFFVKRDWQDLFLIEGNRANDQRYAESLRRSAKKFGLKLVKEKQWLVDADIRRNASLEVPAFTRARSYDVVVVADEDQDFGHYLLYNTWLARPVAGSAGLQPVVWSRVLEQWGALQLQSRFYKLAQRDMTGVDYANWAAVRSIGEAVTRLNSSEPAKIADYLLGDQFELAGFKGHSLTYRNWNGQLRQPVPLVHAYAVTANAPLEGFLHHSTELDTLGVDKQQSQCDKFE